MIPEPQWRPSNAEYHVNHTFWSSSMLSTFRHSPKLAYLKYVSGFDAPDEDPTPALVLGSIVNTLILTPEGEHPDRIVAVPCESRSTKMYKEAVLANPGRLVVPMPVFEEGASIARSILEPDTKAGHVAQALLRAGEGFTEYAHRWQEERFPEGGNPVALKLKCMVDRLAAVAGVPAIVELKTARDPSPDGFARQFFQLDYHCQAAHNTRGITHALGGVPPAFYVVAVRNAEPYEVAVYTVSPEFIALGEAQLSNDYRTLGECLSGLRPWCADYEQLRSDIPVLEPPAWAKRQLFQETFRDTF